MVLLGEGGKILEVRSSLEGKKYGRKDLLKMGGSSHYSDAL